MGDFNAAPPSTVNKTLPRWLFDILLVVVLLAGAYFRFVGLDWDQNQHLHPDERFLTMVESAIMPVGAPAEMLGPPPTVENQPWRSAYLNDLPDCQAWGGYFDTACSPLNPNNRGYTFFVYGTLPIFMVRYAGEWLGRTGYDQIHLVGRQLSALMDLGVVLLVYLIANRLYHRRPLALLAAGFASFSVLPIQLSHYFTVDTFTNFFGMLALLFAVQLLLSKQPEDGERGSGAGPLFIYILFGAALGLAAASKINAVFLAALLPGAALIRYLSQTELRSRAGLRGRVIWKYLASLTAGALVALIVFRIFQPYAFIGPGLLDLKPNPQWISTIRSLAAQSTGDVDFPPALQWARRPLTFSLTNMVLWGLGLPLGLSAWAGFLYMGYRILRSIFGRPHTGEWSMHLLIWGWTGFYFTYQAVSFVRTMRYQMLVYPTLAIIAAWALSGAWPARGHERRARWLRFGTAVAILVLTAAWAFAFTRIYTRPVTRVEASRWIYQNVPGPINLRITTGNVVINQPVAYLSGLALRTGEPPLALAFRPRQAGSLSSIAFDRLGSPASDLSLKTVHVFLSATPDGAAPLAQGMIENEFRPADDPRGSSYTVNFERPAALDPGKMYYLVVALAGSQHSLNMSGPVTLAIDTASGAIRQELPEPVDALRVGQWYQVNVTPVQSGVLNEVVLNHVVDWEDRPEAKTLRLSILAGDGSDMLVAQADVQDSFVAQGDIRGLPVTFLFTQPVNLAAGNAYTVRIQHLEGPGALAIYGSRQANESSWDDALPLAVDGYNPYDYSQGIYRSDLNFEMYWDDNPEKLQRFLSILDQADYIFISSNRQWGTTVRVPERYPLTTAYYRQLLGCPAGKAVTWCYAVAQPGMFHGTLGYELAAVFQSDPNLGSLRFNSQFAEEAFTVYDAPKVMIFRKLPAYDPERVRAELGAVDLQNVVHLTPRKASSYPASGEGIFYNTGVRAAVENLFQWFEKP